VTFRIGRNCHYEIAAVSNTKPDSGGTPLHTALAFDLEQYSASSIHLNIKHQAWSLLGSEIDILDFSTKYFNTIHAWFPIISQKGYQKQLPHTSDTYPDQFLLSACMLLLATLPENGEISAWSRSVYVFIRGAICLLESCGVESNTLLQCRLLITNFEVGHGLHPAAYVSIGTVARAGATLNLQSDCKSPSSKNSVSCESEEETRLIWRGTLILER
jgi:hypothetical protein